MGIVFISADGAAYPADLHCLPVQRPEGRDEGVGRVGAI